MTASWLTLLICYCTHRDANQNTHGWLWPHVCAQTQVKKAITNSTLTSSLLSWMKNKDPNPVSKKVWIETPVPSVLHYSVSLNLTHFAVDSSLVDTHPSTLRDLLSQLHFVYFHRHKIHHSAAQRVAFCPAQQSDLVSSSWTDAPVHGLFIATTPPPLRRLMHGSKLICTLSGSLAKEYIVGMQRKRRLNGRALTTCPTR